MSVNEGVSAETHWADPNQCPFCRGSLVDGGAGFIDHIDANPNCEAGFERWRGRVRQDMAGGWSG